MSEVLLSDLIERAKEERKIYVCMKCYAIYTEDPQDECPNCHDSSDFLVMYGNIESECLKLKRLEIFADIVETELEGVVNKNDFEDFNLKGGYAIVGEFKKMALDPGDAVISKFVYVVHGRLFIDNAVMFKEGDDNYMTKREFESHI